MKDEKGNPILLETGIRTPPPPANVRPGPIPSVKKDNDSSAAKSGPNDAPPLGNAAGNSEEWQKASKRMADFSMKSDPRYMMPRNFSLGKKEL